MHDDDHGNGDVGKVGSSQVEACICLIILWDLPVCLEMRKLLTLKYFRLMIAAFKIYCIGAPSEAKRQVNAGIAFIKPGTDILLQELPKYRAVLSSKKLIVFSLKIKRQAKKAIDDRIFPVRPLRPVIIQF